MSRFFFILIILLSSQLSGQTSKPEMVLRYNANKVVDLNALKSFNGFDASFNLEQLGLTSSDTLIAHGDVFQSDEFKHQKYYQYHNGLKVIGGEYVIHYRNGKAIRATGSVLPGINIPILKSEFQLDKFSLTEELKQSMVKWGYPEITNFDWTFTSIGNCIIDASYPEFSGDYRQAIQFNVKGQLNHDDPLNETVFVDMVTGRIINHFSNVHYERVKGVANTHYYGEKEIYIDSASQGRYLLWDEEKNIVTLDNNNQRDTFENDSKYWNQFNTSRNEVAGDVHYGASAFYDMMKDNFSWIGLDGQGSELKSVLHFSGKYWVNASWDGEKARFGNGDCDQYDPLTTLDIVGHEFVHGFTDFTSDLVYRNESGALNESLSDIFGKALEYYYDRSRFNWLIGDRIRKSEGVNVIRSMEDPHDRFDPKFYGGNYWISGLSDNGGVHSNSGVLNHWFYLLVEGGTGVNEEDLPYSIEGIGIDKALRIVFDLQVYYLTSNSQYRDAYRYSKLVCEDLYGLGSSEYIALQEAWKAVGLYQDTPDYDLAISAEFNELAICRDQEYFPEFIVTNTGANVITTGSELALSFNYNSTPIYSESIQLTEDFLPGDTLIMSPKQPLSTDLVSTNYMRVLVNYEEERILTNNLLHIYTYKSETSDTDIELSNVTLGSSGTCFDGDLSSLRVRVHNTGCSTISRGTNYNLNMNTDLGNYQLHLDFYSDMDPGSLRSFSYSTFSYPEVDLIPDETKSFTAELDMSGDQLSDNNVYSGVVSQSEYLPQSFHTSFDDDVYESFSISISDFYMEDTIINLDGNNMLAFAAVQDHDYYDNCNDPEDFIDEYFGDASMRICIDTRGMDHPVFAFDLMQFRNEQTSAAPPDPHFSNMVRVSVFDIFAIINNEEIEDDLLIYGQPEGDLIHYEVDLPLEYEGEINVEVLCLTANTFDPGHSFLENRDVALFDDLRIFDKGEVLTDYDVFNYLVFPNPSHGLLTVLNEDRTQEFDVAIFDILGHKIGERTAVRSQARFNLQNFPAGVYTIMISEEGNFLQTRKFLKVDRN